MVILSKDIETKEIEIPGFRKILNNPKSPDYKELRIYIKNGWIPVDREDDEKEKAKMKKKRDNAKQNKSRRPTYEVMESKIKDLKYLSKKEKLKEFLDKKSMKGNYNNVLNWYFKTLNEEAEAKKNKEEAEKDSTKVKKDNK